MDQEVRVFSHLVSHVSRITSHISHLTSHISHLTSHISHLISHIFYFVSHISYLISHTVSYTALPGIAKRQCLEVSGGASAKWEVPDLSECVSDEMMDIAQQVM